jgi:hypothetical protein
MGNLVQPLMPQAANLAILLPWPGHRPSIAVPRHGRRMSRGERGTPSRPLRHRSGIGETSYAEGAARHPLARLPSDLSPKATGPHAPEAVCPTPPPAWDAGAHAAPGPHAPERRPRADRPDRSPTGTARTATEPHAPEAVCPTLPPASDAGTRAATEPHAPEPHPGADRPDGSPAGMARTATEPRAPDAVCPHRRQHRTPARAQPQNPMHQNSVQARTARTARRLARRARRQNPMHQNGEARTIRTSRRAARCPSPRNPSRSPRHE